ncbi:MAG: NADP-dependent malic enzyme [Fimbriimonadaceae bacterium]|nr:NADP-dependent malic enzyme [Fimbriimonadaceae bacterium]
MPNRDTDALAYHEMGRPGKLEVVPTKPCLTARDLSLAYSPGVAVPCLEIEKDAGTAYRYTNKGNLVAVVSNGTAVLGLGDIGALAGKPVMEGKAVLFKRFAQIDVFDIEVNTHDPKEVIRVCELLEPTFGGINLEDIKAPECFEIEEALKERLNIPVFHDDQHGTAIITGAALLNALELVGKEIGDVRLVVSGAGASALACTRFFEQLGVRAQNILLCDSKGVVYVGRGGSNAYKDRYARETPLRTLADALRGADVFLGCSVKGLVSGEMLRSMAERPIVFALANPDPEIPYEEAKAARPDAIVATGRSDFPNQVNNVLGFPFIFRGALDVRATRINEPMKVAAAKAIAALAREPVPEEVGMAYGGQRFEFGPDYIIPKPFDPRLLRHEATAVARAACETGVAREPITDWEAYGARLDGMASRSEILMQRIRSVARRTPMRVLFAEGENPKVLEACRILIQEGTAFPVLLGDRAKIEAASPHYGFEMSEVEAIDPLSSPDRDTFEAELRHVGFRKGVNPKKARHLIESPLRFGLMMLRTGRVDAMVVGADDAYGDTIRAALPLTSTRQGVRRAAGFNVLLIEGQVFVIGDTTLNIEPNSRELADIALLGAELAGNLGLAPKVAMLSFSNFGENEHPRAKKVRDAVAFLHRHQPDLVVDGEMHGDVAVLPGFAQDNYPGSRVRGDANVLICPDLDSANIAMKLVGYLGQGREVVGPLLEGLDQAINFASFNASAREIANLAVFSGYRAARAKANVG